MIEAAHDIAIALEDRQLINRRILALDGFRGFAICLVLADHFFETGTGVLGVDMFFVLSGYLITSILRAEREERNYWKIFYVRRATRILPSYLLLIAATAFLFALPWRVLWPYFAFFSANVAFYRYTTLLMPISMCWSLAIEEHFYLLWPAAVRYCSDAALAWTLSAVMVLEPLIRVIAMSVFHVSWGAVYLLTPFRLDGLACGALASILLSSERPREFLDKCLKPALTAIYILSLLVFFMLRILPQTTPITYALVGYPLSAGLFGLLLSWLVLHQESAVSRAFSWFPLRFLVGLVTDSTCITTR